MLAISEGKKQIKRNFLFQFATHQKFVLLLNFGTIFWNKYNKNLPDVEFWLSPHTRVQVIPGHEIEIYIYSSRHYLD